MKCSDSNILLLCNFDDQHVGDHKEDKFISNMWSGIWSIDETDVCKTLLDTKLDIDSLVQYINSWKDENCIEPILCIAIKSFLTFCDQNWNPHPDKLDLDNYLRSNWPKDIDATLKLQRDSEPVFVNILYPELLYFSLQIFRALYTIEENLLHLWWYFRTIVVHQRALEDTSATLYAELELIIAKLTNELQKLQDKPRLQILLSLEIAQAFLIYARIHKVEEYLSKAREIAGLKLELTGILGKRTKFQQRSLPQLALFSELDLSVDRPSAEESHGSSELPPEIELQDDVRLNKIDYNEKITQAELPSLEQILCLLTV